MARVRPRRRAAPRRLGAPRAPAVPGDLGRARAEPRRVLAVDRLRPPLRRGRRRLGARARDAHGRTRLDLPRAPLRRRLAGDRAGLGRHRVRRLPEPPAVQREDDHERRGRRPRRRDRSGALAAGDRPERDVADRGRGTRLRRRLARQGVRAERPDGSGRLGVQDRRGGQGRRGGRGADALRRLVRRARVRARHAHRPPGLARERGQPPLRPLDLLLDACGRVRPRLHRRDGRQGLLVRRREREAALVAEHRRLRLRLARGVEPARLRRLVRRVVLRARRGHGRRGLAVPGERAHLRLGERDRRRRLLLDVPQQDVRPRRAHREARVEPAARDVRRRRRGSPLPLRRRLQHDLRLRAEGGVCEGDVCGAAVAKAGTRR